MCLILFSCGNCSSLCFKFKTHASAVTSLIFHFISFKLLCPLLFVKTTQDLPRNVRRNVGSSPAAILSAHICVSHPPFFPITEHSMCWYLSYRFKVYRCVACRPVCALCVRRPLEAERQCHITRDSLPPCHDGLRLNYNKPWSHSAGVIAMEKLTIRQVSPSSTLVQGALYGLIHAVRVPTRQACSRRVFL